MEDVQLLAKCGFLEARGEGAEGMRAVMHCVINRIGFPGFPKTLQTVILQPNAFSWTRPDNPEYGLTPPETDELFATALQIAATVLSGTDVDVTAGAHYYANLATQQQGGWFQRVISGPDGQGTPAHPKTVQILHHTFYK